MTVKQVIRELKKRQNGESLRAFAARIGCSVGYLNDVFHGRREPGPKIAEFLGLRMEVKRKTSVRKEFRV